MKKFSIILVAIMLVLSLGCLVACNNETAEDNTTMYAVTFDNQTGEDAQVVYVADGTTVAKPNTPLRAYAQFTGWYSDKDCTVAFDFTTPITADIILYAGWKFSEVKVTFKYNYTGAPASTSITINKGSVIIYPDIPVRECYVFTGWYKEAKAKTLWKDNDVIKEDLILYAGWELEANHVHNLVVTSSVDATCDDDGYDVYTCKCGYSESRKTDDALGHNYELVEGEYFRMFQCTHEGCTNAVRNESERNYDDKFVFTFTAEKKAEIDEQYNDMLEYIENADEYNADLHSWVKPSTLYDENKAFENDYYNKFYDNLEYVLEQYQYAYVFYCVDQNDEEKHTAYEDISEYRTDIIKNYYSLFRLIYETKYRDYFFSEEDGWTEDDIQMALAMSDSYGGDEYAELNKRKSEIEIEFRDLKNPDTDEKTLELYEEFVEINKQIAEIAGYDNYVEYAYENIYGRDYSPENVATMRNYVKKYIKTVYTTIFSNYLATYNEKFFGNDLLKTYDDAFSASIFNSYLATDAVADYFELMTSDAFGKDIDFYNDANELFKNGNYYNGNYDGAFSYYVSAQSTSILYFGSGYSDAFTFVHEFGHYFNNVYNLGASMSYDLDETQSQGDEMLFLSYLKNWFPEGTEKVYNKVKYDQLFNALAIICLATAVDEFEQAVYADSYVKNGKEQYPNGIGADDYDGLFLKIMSDYGIADSLNSAYWRYVVIEAPCYYISYAMSMLPSLELYVIAETDGFEDAQESYFKLFTFTDDEENVHTDSVGDVVIDIGYEDTLHYAGLLSPFEEDLFIKIKEYFS